MKATIRDVSNKTPAQCVFPHIDDNKRSVLPCYHRTIPAPGEMLSLIWKKRVSNSESLHAYHVFNTFNPWRMESA